MRMKSVTNHTIQAVLEGALVSLLVIGLMAGTAFAGKGGSGGGGKGGGGNISGGGGSVAVVLVEDANGNGSANWSDKVTFTVSTTATDKPSVKLNCTQGGALVYTSSAGFYPDYPWPWAQTFTLASGAWTGGAADCTASLYYFNGRSYPVVATTSFHAGA